MFVLVYKIGFADYEQKQIGERSDKYLIIRSKNKCKIIFVRFK